MEGLRQSKKYVDEFRNPKFSISIDVLKSAQLDESEDEQMTEPPDPDQMFTVLISTRSFLKFLNSHVVSTTTIACNFLF